MSRVAIVAFAYLAAFAQCKLHQGAHAGQTSLVESINGFADLSARQAVTAIRSDALSADQGTDNEIAVFLGNLAANVITPQPVALEAEKRVKAPTESVTPKLTVHRDLAKIQEAAPTTPSPKRASSTTLSIVSATMSKTILTKMDREELEKEVRTELRSELTKEILEELKHNHSASIAVGHGPAPTGHVVNTVSSRAMSEVSVARTKQSNLNVTAQSKTAIVRKKANIEFPARVESKIEASLLKTVVGTKTGAIHAKVVENKREHVSTAARSNTLIRKARRLKVTFDTKAVARPPKSPLGAAEGGFESGLPPKMQHQVPEHTLLASTSSGDSLKLGQRVRDLQGELLPEQTLLKEAAAVASRKTGRPEGDWSPGSPQSSALGDWKRQVVELEADSQEERHMREEAADTAEHATPESESPTISFAKAEEAVLKASPPAPQGFPSLPWQHAAAEHPVMSAVTGGRPLTAGTAPQGFFAAAHRPPQGLFAVAKRSFEWITGGRIQWFFEAATQKVAPKATALTQTGSSAPTPLRLGHSLQFPATRAQEFAKVAATARRDRAQSISLGATFLEMEDRDTADEDELQHADAYMRSVAETADLPHVMSELERAERRRESVHVSDVWKNLEQQDSDIEQAIDSMGPETNLNKMGEIDSIQDQSMAALSRQVDSAGDHDTQLLIPRIVAPQDLVHEQFEQLQQADEGAEERIKLDPSMRRE